MTEPSSGRWVHLDTEITNNSGRITYNVPRPRRLGVGVYPVKMVVRSVQDVCEAIHTVDFGGLSHPCVAGRQSLFLFAWRKAKGGGHQP